MKQINDAFNAKHLKTDQLLSSFVPSKHFMDVAQSSHTLLYGPRGSGKTTLLRMLSADSLPHWQHKDANSYRERICYEGIYVPGDLVWGEMLKSLSQPGIPEECANEFAYTAFCTHIFIAAIAAMESSLSRFIEEADTGELSNIEDDLISSYQTTAALLKLDMDKFSLSRIRNALYIRFSELGDYPSRIYGKTDYTLNDLRADMPCTTIQLKTTLEAIFDTFDRALGRKEHRWALLLDEFEIAPQVLLERILQNMRSSAPKILIKVALVPCGLHQNIEALISNNNDLRAVELWYRKKGEISTFCNSLLKAKYGIPTPEKLFGKTKFINNSQGKGKGEEKDQLWHKEFESLAEKDESFASYLKEKDYDIDRIFLGDDEKTSLIRKIAPRVAFRNAFMNTSGGNKGRQSLHEFYSGWEAISTISDGNPRWLMATIDSLLALEQDNQGMIPQEQQYKIIQKTCEAFSTMIASTALKDNMGISTDTPPFDALNQIGSHFRDTLVKEDFKPDPSLTFIVDEQVGLDLENSLRIALNHGAIVSLDSEQDFWKYRSLKGMRFRISYLLAPVIQLPLRMEKQINLSSIYNKKTTSKVKRTTNRSATSAQRNLF
ncbi:MAG: hypothetical protein ACRBB6_07575 [Neptuniibacter sp.]